VRSESLSTSFCRQAIHISHFTFHFLAFPLSLLIFASQYLQMNISYNWLKDYLNFDLAPEEVSDILTGVGLEVEALNKYESIRGGLEGLKIGYVTSVEKHPDADKLTVTKVNVGGETDLQIVCGAPNVAAGQKVIVATDGVLLHPFNGEPFRIKKTKLRGVASEGMICAEDEIGLSEDHGGIMILPENAETGTWAKDFLNVQTDYIFEVGLTPNRGDAMSHIGVDRDILAYLRAHYIGETTLKIPAVANFPEIKNPSPFEVTVENTTALPAVFRCRYLGN
jgi:phenylalanyl-tRNA synthetase beta chain